jgi:hypothetical protein
VAAGDTDTALDLLANAVKTLAQSKNPPAGSARSRAELAHVYEIYGEAYAARRGFVTARHWYERSKQVLTDLRDTRELDANGAEILVTVQEELAKLAKVR